MPSYIFITNNPAVAGRYGTARLLNAPVTQVLNAVKEAVHRGAALLSPLDAAVTRYGLNPYKSVILSDTRGQLDFNSLKQVEEATALYKKNAAVRYRAYNEALLADFQSADAERFESALAGLPKADAK